MRSTLVWRRVAEQENAQNNDWEFFEKSERKKMRRGEVLNQGSKQLETSGKPNSPTNWSINPTNQNVPRGHDL